MQTTSKLTNRRISQQIINDYDTNGNGTQDTGETGVPNGTVILIWDQNGNGVADLGEPALETITDVGSGGGGIYHFTGLPPGKYVVQADASTVVSPTHPGVYGTMVLTNSYGENYPVDLPAGGSNLTADFGFIEGALVSGTVFYDKNSSGALDSGELGLGTVTVTLTGKDISGNTVTKTTTTVGGNYSFIVPPGNYTISYDTTKTTTLGYPKPTTPLTDVISVAAGQELDNQNFGVTYSGSIGDRVWNDANGNGVQDSGESGIAGVTLNLYLDADGNENTTGDQTLLATTATNALGNYTFSGLPDTTGLQKYVVKVNTATLPSGYTETGEGQPGSLCTGLTNGCDNQIATTLTGGATLTNVDLGYKPPTNAHNVTGNVWNDNGDGGGGGGNGIKGGTEPGIQNVSVCLYQSDGVTVVACTTTDTNGNYTFPGIADGSYIIRVNPATLPSSAYTQTGVGNAPGAPCSISNPCTNQDPVTVNDADPTPQYFGYQQVPGSIAGTVCVGNGDGQCSAGESPMANVQVKLTYAGPDGILNTADDTTQTTTTNASGAYSFPNLAPGLYQIVKTNPPGTQSLADADGGNPDNITVGHDHRSGHSNLQESQLADVDSDAKEGAGRNDDRGRSKWLPPRCRRETGPRPAIRTVRLAYSTIGPRSRSCWLRATCMSMPTLGTSRLQAMSHAAAPSATRSIWMPTVTARRACNCCL